MKLPQHRSLTSVKNLVRDLKSAGLCQPCDIPGMLHPEDRTHRQKGGEGLARKALKSFLNSRGEKYATAVSSPNSAWNGCSRLSPYLSAGHISVRLVVHELVSQQQKVRSRPKGDCPSLWAKSLAAFHSRMRWRSHFIQKLESQPEIETTAQCPAYDHLRCADGDWNVLYYQAWAEGRTGFPFVDACMRCLLVHGWLNFRMRAMLVTFATYNLWLDWRKIAPHLARCFLDYEPGIHYPQLQMQAGSTGINAMRVYSVSKQGVDQDREGRFIRKYVPELSKVPTNRIHHPNQMSIVEQQAAGVTIMPVSEYFGLQTADCDASPTYPQKSYPQPIVDEKMTAKVGKDRVAMIRRQESTKEQAAMVYARHGSRMRRDSDRQTKPSGNKHHKKMASLVNINHSSAVKSAEESERKPETEHSSNDMKHHSILEKLHHHAERRPKKRMRIEELPCAKKSTSACNFIINATIRDEIMSSSSCDSKSAPWTCSICTFENTRPLAPVCEICQSKRSFPVRSE